MVVSNKRRAAGCDVPTERSRSTKGAGCDGRDVRSLRSHQASRPELEKTRSASSDVTALSLECAGLMSALPHDEVVRRLAALEEHARRLGAVKNPFMYLSFLALTVIPEVRVTERGVFDVRAFADVPLFSE